MGKKGADVKGPDDTQIAASTLNHYFHDESCIATGTPDIRTARRQSLLATTAFGVPLVVKPPDDITYWLGVMRRSPQRRKHHSAA
jgi:hypothetical protein